MATGRMDIVFGGRNFTFPQVDCLVSIRTAALQAAALIEQITGKIEPVSQSYFCTKNSLNYNISRQCQENSIPKPENFHRIIGRIIFVTVAFIFVYVFKVSFSFKAIFDLDLFIT